jgi:hypothetical protein
MKKDENHLVVQSNFLVEAQYKLGVMPQIIIRDLVSRIKPDDDTFKARAYRLVAADFAALIGREYTGQVIKDIKAAAETLMKTQLTIKRKRELTRTNWLASYKHHLDEGWFEFSFSLHLERELLLIKDQFTQYHLMNVSKLRSQYSIRLYELLKQYIVVGHRKIVIDELKGMLGIEKDEYRLFTHIRQRVLIPAHREICAKTDIEFQWKPFKHVRKIIGVEFYDIRSKAPHVPDWIIGLLPAAHRANKDILKNVRRWLDLKGDEYVREKIQYSVSRNPAKFADYLFTALEKDYGEGFTPAQPDLPFAEGGKAGYKVKDGMQIEISGVTYTVEDGHISTAAGIIPRGEIVTNLKAGKWKIIDIASEAPFEAEKSKAKHTKKSRKSS